MDRKNIFSKVEKVADKSKYLTSISAMVLMAIILLVVTHVVLRTIWRAPLKITYDYISCFTVVVVSLALVECTYKKGHACVGFILDKFPQKFQDYVDLIALLLMLIVYSLFTYSMIIRTQDLYLVGDVTMATKTPLFPFMGIMTASFVVIVLLQAYRLFEHIFNRFIRR